MNVKIEVEANHQYELYFYIKKLGPWPTTQVSADYFIFLDETLVAEGSLYDDPSQPVSEELNIAADWVNWKHKVQNDCDLNFIAESIDAQVWELSIYKDLPDNIEFVRAFFIYFSLGCGLVLGYIFLQVQSPLYKGSLFIILGSIFFGLFSFYTILLGLNYEYYNLEYNDILIPIFLALIGASIIWYGIKTLLKK
ncbi:MAG: membrane protein of unknown function [Promethearchaeota archaeon]|nr:MAG: membrane protein of unknown function [Candidatus Lokiarchaeota archaeon]